MSNYKPIVQLTMEDLKAFPVWEYVNPDDHNEGDETWVHPTSVNHVPRNVYSRIVASEFTTPRGKQLPGFMIVSTPKRCIEINPGAILHKGYHILPTVSRETARKEGFHWSVRDRDLLLKELRSKEAGVFPLRFQLGALIHGESKLRVGVVE
ncbi:MAG: hypothetical protein AB1705_20220 [Verrucomicrobiota bacterium]